MLKKKDGLQTIITIVSPEKLNQREGKLLLKPLKLVMVLLVCVYSHFPDIFLNEYELHL